MFASRKSIIYDYKNNKVVQELPPIPGVPRSYPLTGGAVMLPLDPKNNYNVEILVCGGSKETKDTSPADDTCGRINLGDKNPTWKMETFIHKRLMPDGVFLLDGTVLWVNGCQRGWAGYNNRNHDPTFDPLIYDPAAPKEKRWTEGLANTDIARMYHSVALTLPDGRVWIAGSNNVDPPDIYAEYPTEYRVEYFSPPYLFRGFRPHYAQLPRVVTYGQRFSLQLHLELDEKDPEKLRVAVIRPGFSTHSMHMSQRYVYLVHEVSSDFQSVSIEAPPNANLFPPGQGFLVVVYDGVPSRASEFFIEHDVSDLAI
jgi:hypothetical protein